MVVINLISEGNARCFREKTYKVAILEELIDDVRGKYLSIFHYCIFPVSYKVQ